MDEKWTFITNHGLVLSHIAQNPSITAREIALTIGITERTTHKIITDLEQANYITKTKVGRRNIYDVNFRNHLRHHSKKNIEVSGEIGATHLITHFGYTAINNYKKRIQSDAGGADLAPPMTPMLLT